MRAREQEAILVILNIETAPSPHVKGSVLFDCSAESSALGVGVMIGMHYAPDFSETFAVTVNYLPTAVKKSRNPALFYAFCTLFADFIRCFE